MGIQNLKTQFRSLNGPEEPLTVQSDITFDWVWDGFGKQYCYFDAQNYTNDADFTCRAPVTTRLHDSKNHTLQIVLEVSTCKLCAHALLFNLCSASQLCEGGFISTVLHADCSGLATVAQFYCGGPFLWFAACDLGNLLVAQCQ